MTQTADPSFTIRSFCAPDAPACQKLYLEGLLGGRIAENDTGLDINDIDAAYMKAEGNHFWIAQCSDGQIVGMVGVQHHEPGMAEIRRLRVHTEYRRRGIGSALMEKAVHFCQERGYLKITLDTFMEREPAVKLFEKFRFKHSRTRTLNGKELLYFYLDLYTTDRPQKQS